MAIILDTKDWAERPGEWIGELQLGAYDAGICLIFNLTEKGGGPKLHRHPYAETFIIRSGRAIFTLGDNKVEARPGQILIAPAGMPHAFTNPDDAILETIDVHESGKFITEWLE